MIQNIAPAKALAENESENHDQSTLGTSIRHSYSIDDPLPLNYIVHLEETFAD